MTPNESPTLEAEAASPEIPGTPIRPGTNAAVPPRAPATANGESVRPYINDQLNSRLSRDVPEGPIALRWEANLAPEFPTSFVLASGNRILTQSTGRWQLFDPEGKSLGGGKRGAGDLVMDTANGLFYSIDPFGVIEAHSLNNAQLEFSVNISGGEEWYRAFHARRGNEWVIVSFQQQIQPHAPAEPAAVAIDVQDLGNPPDIQQHIVVSAKQKSRLYYELPNVFAALAGDTLVASMRNQILVTAFGHQVRARLTGKFEPGPLSLDETGRIHALVMQPGHAQPALWVLATTGERVFAFEAPADVQLRLTPPVIGHNHQVYLTTRDSVMCVSPQGSLLWRRPSQGAVAGIAVTPNDTVLVAEGATLSVLDARGERRVLRAFNGDTLITPPAMTAAGEIVVASAKRLYVLSNSRAK